MKHLLPLPLALLLAAALPGCNGAARPAEQAATTPEAQAGAAQDSLMGQHDRLMSQADNLIALAARLQAAPHPPRPLLRRLQAADDAMMTWMHQYQAPDSAAPATQRLTYLRGQQRQLAAVERQMQAAVDSATALVSQLPPNPNAGPAVPLPDAPTAPKK